MKNNKKIAAASAVLAYIKEEEEIAGAMVMQAQAGSKEAPAYQQMSMWGMSGRQTQMQLRSMMQLKAFHGLKIR